MSILFLMQTLWKTELSTIANLTFLKFIKRRVTTLSSSLETVWSTSVLNLGPLLRLNKVSYSSITSMLEQQFLLGLTSLQTKFVV